MTMRRAAMAASSGGNGEIPFHWVAMASQRVVPGRALDYNDRSPGGCGLQGSLMSQYKISSVAAVWLSLFGGMLAQVALAQQSRSDSPQLEEIMVTAEKRESTVQTTPISLTAVSGAGISGRGLTDLGKPGQSGSRVSIGQRRPRNG